MIEGWGKMNAAEKRELAQLMVDTLPTMGRLLEKRMRRVRPRHQLQSPHITLLKQLKDGSQIQSELADVLMVGGSTLSATLDALERRGWVTRTRMESDRRMVQIALTPEGASVVEDIENYAYDGLRDIVDGLSDEEAYQALAGLRVLRGIIARGPQSEREFRKARRHFEDAMEERFGPDFLADIVQDVWPKGVPFPPGFEPPIPPDPPAPPRPPGPFGPHRGKRKFDDDDLV
jgi:DNA-binding MarR family transcriptional regulator